MSVDCLKKLVSLTPLTGKEWCVYTYILNSDNNDDLKGLFFILGCFDTYQAALNHTHYIIEQTGCQKVGIARYSAAINLTNVINNDSIDVPVDIKGKLIKFENQLIEKERKMVEDKIKRDEEYKKECEEEYDDTHIEHYKRNVYLTLKHLALINEYQQKINELQNLYQIRKNNVIQHYQLYPEHDTQFLPYLKDKLVKRGEEVLYNNIEQLYLKYRDQLLK